jgi:predicted hydrocarbon binding protein
MDNEALRKCQSLLERTEYYDDEGEWRIAGSDWLLISGATFRNLIKVVERVLGPGAPVIMLEAGKHAGKQFADDLLKEGLTKRELGCALEVFFTQGGWGKVQTRADFPKQRIVVRIHNSVTTRKIKASEAECHFIRGYIAGVSGVMFSKNVECVETLCRAKADTFCEFRAHAYKQHLSNNHVSDKS